MLSICAQIVRSLYVFIVYVVFVGRQNNTKEKIRWYYGNLEPQKSNLKQNADFNRVCEVESILRNSLADEQKELFKEYADLWSLILGDTAFDSFASGFKHGAGFALDSIIHLDKGLFVGMFDFNNDGKIDSFEKAAEFSFFYEYDVRNG